MRCVIYTRFSPRRNADESESCEAQERICRDHAEKNGWIVAAVVDDPDRSGADEFRAKLWEAVDLLRDGDALLVYKRDRLARNLYLAEQINRMVDKKGARIVAVSGDVDGDTPEVIMIRQVLAAIAEYERKIIAIRTSHLMRAHQAAGRRMSRECPYGYSDDPNNPAMMMPNEAEREVVDEMLAMRGEGKSIAEITRWLNDNRLALARHGRWAYKTVRKICLR